MVGRKTNLSATFIHQSSSTKGGSMLLDARVWLREASSFYYYAGFSGCLLHAARRRV